MTTIDRRAFLESATALAAVAALRPRPAAAAGGPKKAVYVSMLPKELGYRERFQMALDVGFEGIEIGTITDPAVADRDPGGLREDGAQDPLRDERRPLEVPALERRPRGRGEERRGHGGLPAQREALGRGQRAAGAGRPEPRDLLPGRLDALAEGDQGAHPAPRPGAEGGDRDRGGLEQVPAVPARDGALRGRVRLALGQGLRRRRQHGLLRLPAGLGPHPRAADLPRPHQGLQARPRERASSSGRTSARATSTGRRCARRSARSATTAGSRPRSTAGTRPT